MTQDTTRIAPADLAQLLGSRLCHDLVSPLGAIGNGVELIEMSSDFPGIGTSPELKLIAESVASARARIQVFRVAFGQAQGEQRMSHTGLAQLLQVFSSQGRLHVRLEAEGDFARTELRMILLAMMCMESAMPWGGRVTVLHGAQGWDVTGQADRIKQDATLWAWLGGADPRHPAPSEVHFPLLAQALAEAGRKADWDLGEGAAQIRF